MSKYVLAFDVYGTLLDTSGITSALSEHLRLDKATADAVSALWRRYQLEYTWRLNSMKLYKSFDIVTEKSLRHALKEIGITFNESDINNLMNAYQILPSFPDAFFVLQRLESYNNVRIVIFTNGTKEATNKALSTAGLNNFALDFYAADNHQGYKPSLEIYEGLQKHVDKEDQPKDCWLVSGNPFDITGALASGMRAIWVDRANKGWVDQLLPLNSPVELDEMKIVHSLEEIPELLDSLQ